MVEVFGPKEEFYSIAEKAIQIGAKVLWGQICQSALNVAPQSARNLDPLDTDGSSSR